MVTVPRGALLMYLIYLSPPLWVNAPTFRTSKMMVGKTIPSFWNRPVFNFGGLDIRHWMSTVRKKQLTKSCFLRRFRISLHRFLFTKVNRKKLASENLEIPSFLFEFADGWWPTQVVWKFETAVARSSPMSLGKIKASQLGFCLRWCLEKGTTYPLKMVVWMVMNPMVRSKKSP